MSQQSDENVLVTLFFIIIFCFGAIVGLGLNAFTTRHDKTNAVCDYLHAKREGDVCIKDGAVVFRKGQK